MLTAINEEMNRFETKPKFIKVKAHTNIFWNEKVDKLAKEAAEEKQQTITIHLQKDTTYLHQNNKIVEIYPSTKIKKDLQTNLSKEIDDKIKTIWPEINTKISKKFTIPTAKTNYLDTTFMSKQNFRQHIILNTLPTKYKTHQNKITKDKLCPRCHIETETIKHIFTCRHTKDIYTQLIQETKESIGKINKMPNKHRIDQIYKLLDLDNPENFLTKEIALGIINNNFITQYKTLFTPFEKDKLKTLQLILETWLNKIHEKIWKYRCNIIFKKTTPPYPIPKLTLHLNPNKRKQTFKIKYTKPKLKFKLTFKKPRPYFKLIFRGSG